MGGTTWSKFYWSDWLSDPAVRTCSLAARGLWIDMLCIAAGHDPIGYVAVNGRNLSAEEIARTAGLTAPEVETLLGELERNGVFSRDRKGVIFSRRMVRDEKRAKTARKNGKNGGNPTLLKTVASDIPVKGQVKDRDKPHKPEANSQKPEEQQQLRPPDLTRRTREDFLALEAALREASGLSADQSASAKLADVSPIIGLIDAGVSLEGLILPVLRSKRGKCSRICSWEWFIPAIRQAVEKQQSAKSVGSEIASKAPPPPEPGNEPIDIGYSGLKIPAKNLEAAILRWRENPSLWIWQWGPEPPKHPVISAFAAERGISLHREAAE